jgi:heptosyltransferase-1
MRLLLVKLSSLGDVIHNLPVASDLARHVPGVKLDWVVEAPYAELVSLHPAVQNVYPVGLRALKKQWFSVQAWSTFLQQRKQLAPQVFDGILDTQGLLKSAWIAHWADGPVSGFDAGSAREPLAARFYQHRFAVARDQHAVVRNRALAAAAFGYALSTEVDYGLQSIPPKEAPGSTPYLVFLHATSRRNKMWPDAAWADLGRRAAARGLRTVLPWGSALERQTSERLAAVVPGALVPPPMSLREATQLLAGAIAVVGVDTGLAHLAVALGRPTIGLYLSTDPRLTGLHGGTHAINLGGGSEDSPSIPAVDAVWEALLPYLDQQAR